MSLIKLKGCQKILIFCFNNIFVWLLSFPLGRIQVFAPDYINHYNEFDGTVLLINFLEIPCCLHLRLLTWSNDEELNKNYHFKMSFYPLTNTSKLKNYTRLDICNCCSFSQVLMQKCLQKMSAAAWWIRYGQIIRHWYKFLSYKVYFTPPLWQSSSTYTLTKAPTIFPLWKG